MANEPTRGSLRWRISWNSSFGWLFGMFSFRHWKNHPVIRFIPGSWQSNLAILSKVFLNSVTWRSALQSTLFPGISIIITNVKYHDLQYKSGYICLTILRKGLPSTLWRIDDPLKLAFLYLFKWDMGYEYIQPTSIPEKWVWRGQRKKLLGKASKKLVFFLGIFPKLMAPPR